MKHRLLTATLLLSLCFTLTACKGKDTETTPAATLPAPATTAAPAPETVPPAPETTAPAPETTAEAETTPETFQEYAMYVTDSVRVRTGPNTDSDVMGYHDKGETVTVTGPEENGWLPVRFGDQKGYMSKEFLSSSPQ